jgi:hypothetical protein
MAADDASLPLTPLTDLIIARFLARPDNLPCVVSAFFISRRRAVEWLRKQENAVMQQLPRLQMMQRNADSVHFIDPETTQTLILNVVPNESGGELRGIGHGVTLTIDESL